ncbi:MAG: hypothetical protein ACOCXA_01830, partial [Planctomycetota bacterium]
MRLYQLLLCVCVVLPVYGASAPPWSVDFYNAPTDGHDPGNGLFRDEDSDGDGVLNHAETTLEYDANGDSYPDVPTAADDWRVWECGQFPGTYFAILR